MKNWKFYLLILTTLLLPFSLQIKMKKKKSNNINQNQQISEDTPVNRIESGFRIPEIIMQVIKVQNKQAAKDLEQEKVQKIAQKINGEITDMVTVGQVVQNIASILGISEEVPEIKQQVVDQLQKQQQKLEEVRQQLGEKNMQEINQNFDKIDKIQQNISLTIPKVQINWEEQHPKGWLNWISASFGNGNSAQKVEEEKNKLFEQIKMKNQQMKNTMEKRKKRQQQNKDFKQQRQKKNKKFFNFNLNQGNKIKRKSILDLPKIKIKKNNLLKFN